MAFLQIKSTNPNLSFLLKKNPASGLVARGIRKGVLFGYYSDEGQTFNVFFRDAFNEISYPESKAQEFEYVNITRYSSAQFIINAFAEFLRDPLKKPTELDIDSDYDNLLIVNMVHLSSNRILAAFIQHFAGTCSIEAEIIAKRYYRITFQTKRSLHYLLNLVNLFAAFVVLKNKTEYLSLDENTIEKYFSSLSVIDPPYFIRYHFKIELLRSKRMFDTYKPLLDTSSLYPLEIFQGDTNRIRFDFIEAHINLTANIVDVGCGEGRFVKAFAPKLSKGKTYYAIDTNEELRLTLEKKIKHKGITNACVLESIEDFFTGAAIYALEKFLQSGTDCKQPISDLPEDTYEFILGEVIEHMPIEEAETLIKKCLNFKHTGSIIITTPNKDFNHHYFNDGEELRHSDHMFEFTANEFKTWLDQMIDSSFCYETFNIGDKVNGIPLTLGAVVRRKPNGE